MGIAFRPLRTSRVAPSCHAPARPPPRHQQDPQSASNFLSATSRKVVPATIKPRSQHTALSLSQPSDQPSLGIGFGLIRTFLQLNTTCTFLNENEWNWDDLRATGHHLESFLSVSWGDSVCIWVAALCTWPRPLLLADFSWPLFIWGHVVESLRGMGHRWDGRQEEM